MPHTSKYTHSLLHGLNKSNFCFPAERHSRKTQLSVLLLLSADSMSLKKMSVAACTVGCACFDTVCQLTHLSLCIELPVQDSRIFEDLCINLQIIML